MMKRLIAVSVLALLFGGLLVGLPTEATGQANPKKDLVKPEDVGKEDPAAEFGTNMATAYSLINYGRKTKSPEALITAAGMLRRMPKMSPLKLEADPDNKSDVTKPEAMPSLLEESEKLLKEAKKLSNDDPTVVAMADAILNRKISRAVVTGPVAVNWVLQPGQHYYGNVVVDARPTYVGFIAKSPLQPNQLGYSVTQSQTYRTVLAGVLDCYNGRAGTTFHAPPGTKGNTTLHVWLRNYGKTPAAFYIYMR